MYTDVLAKARWVGAGDGPDFEKLKDGMIRTSGGVSCFRYTGQGRGATRDTYFDPATNGSASTLFDPPLVRFQLDFLSSAGG